MLRLIAILAELESDHQLVVFDEIENGINPELVEFVLNALTSGPQQVLVTTHSPMILNYLSDDSGQGRCRFTCIRHPTDRPGRFPSSLSLPLARKLTVMGPGEAFVDTNLTLLGDEIEQMPGVR